VEKLLERIKNGISVEDRQNAMAELQDIVAESRSAQLAFGATGDINIDMQAYSYEFKDEFMLTAPVHFQVYQLF
jgi:hypothetical protein